MTCTPADNIDIGVIVVYFTLCTIEACTFHLYYAIEHDEHY